MQALGLCSSILNRTAPSLLSQYRYLVRSAHNMAGPVETSLTSKLTAQLKPTRLFIRNDSINHRHHAPMMAVGGGNGETHFFLHIVSDAFAGKATIQRHRMVYAALADEFAQGLHALSLKTQTPTEAQIPETP